MSFKKTVISVCIGLLVWTSSSAGFWDWFYDKPKLTDEQKQWTTYQRNVDTDDPNYPLEVIEDGFKMIKAYRKEKRIIDGNEIPEQDLVKWGWMFKVYNKSTKIINIKVIYFLKDKDGFDITSDEKWKTIRAKDTLIIQEKSLYDLNYDEVERINHSAWSISYY